MKKKSVGWAKDIQKNKSAKFNLRINGVDAEGFVVYHKKKFHAYWNRCRHIPLPLDWGDNDFFTSDGKFLICKNHGALYAPTTGECLAGPCAGDYLEALKVEVKEGKVFVEVEKPKERPA